MTGASLQALRIRNGVPKGRIYRALGITRKRFEKLEDDNAPCPWSWAPVLSALLGIPEDDARYTPETIPDLFTVTGTEYRAAAGAMGVAPHVASAMARGERDMTDAQAEAMASALGVPVGDLLDLADGDAGADCDPFDRSIRLPRRPTYHDQPLSHRMALEAHLAAVCPALCALLSRSDARAWLTLPEGVRADILATLRRGGLLGNAAADYASDARRPPAEPEGDGDRLWPESESPWGRTLNRPAGYARPGGYPRTMEVV